MKFEILEIKKPKLSYFLEEIDASSEFVKIEMEYSSTILDNQEKEELKLFELEFILYLKDENDPEKIFGKYECFYLIYLKTDIKDYKEIEHETLNHLEPYIKQGVVEFSNNNDIPDIKLPFRFWKYAKS